MKRLLVCGGRDFTDHELMTWALNRIHAERGIACIIEGECPTEDNPDKHAARWALSHGVSLFACPVDPALDGPWPGAGPRRNRRMRDLYLPDAGLAFPRANSSWGSGTESMIRLLEEIGVRTWRVTSRRCQSP
jgi:hypothetical protein